MIRYIVIGAEYCRYCQLAKTLLKKEKLKNIGDAVGINA